MAPPREERLATEGCRNRRAIAEELDDPWDEIETRRRSAVLPTPDGRWGHAETLGHVLLEQAEIDPPLPEVVA